MGGHASRDALDVDLLRSEFELLAGLTLECSTIHYYGRMVDDISCVIQGSFDDMTKVLIKMATTYPDMPLNVQISQNFSKFLDLNIYNFYDAAGSDEKYQLTTTLSWKKQNTYNYISEKDNKCPRYKGAVVPVTMTRIMRRCSRIDEELHHRSFIFKILMTRGQCPKRIEERRKNFVKRLANNKNCTFNSGGIVFSSKHDGVSGSHRITENIIRRSAKFKFSMIYKSLPNTASYICPKRKILEKITDSFNNRKLT